MYNSVGGEAEYTKMIQWATDNLPESDITAFNASVDTQNPDLVRFAVQGLNARYRSEVGVQQNLNLLRVMQVILLVGRIKVQQN